MKYIACFFAIACGVLYFMYSYSKRQLSYVETRINALTVSNRELRGNNDVLQTELEKRNNDALEVSQRAQELARLAKEEKNKGGFDWRRNLPDDKISNHLRKD